MIRFASDWAGPVTTVASCEANFDETGEVRGVRGWGVRGGGGEED